MRPDNSVIRRVEPELSARALVQPGKAYAVYLHVPIPQKVDDASPLTGPSVRARIVLDLPAGTYDVQWWNTTTGKIDKSESVRHEGGPLQLETPEFHADLALRIVAEP